MGMFLYGSGALASFFALTFSKHTLPGLLLTNLKRTLKDVPERQTRTKWSPADFVKTMAAREETYHAVPYEPKASKEDLFPGTWYLASVDVKHRREYEQFKHIQNGHH